MGLCDQVSLGGQAASEAATLLARITQHSSQVCSKASGSVLSYARHIIPRKDSNRAGLFGNADKLSGESSA
jgi:hypothetical protein